MQNFVIVLFIVILLGFFGCKTSTEPSNAPADHTLNKDGVKHKPGLADPEVNCISCHGAGLTGTDRAPSCFDCHGREW